MHYFIFGQDYAAVQSDEQAAKYEAAGWTQVGHATFMAFWAARDAGRFAEMWPAGTPLVKSVGADAPLPPGFVRPSNIWKG